MRHEEATRALGLGILLAMAGATGARAADAGADAGTCVDKRGCPALYHCENAECVADRGATCDGDHTVTSPDGARNDCGMYRCEGSACNTTCVSKLDCVDPAICSKGKCMRSALVDDDPPVEGCATSARTAAALPWASLLVLVVVLSFIRRRSAE